MKPDIHPTYRPVVFKDASTGDMFLSKSTMEGSSTVEWEDGNEYPLIIMDVTSASHPFYTGTQRLMDTAGRVERFQKRYGKGKKPAKAAAAEARSEASAESAPDVPAEAPAEGDAKS